MAGDWHGGRSPWRQLFVLSLTLAVTSCGLWFVAYRATFRAALEEHRAMLTPLVRPQRSSSEPSRSVHPPPDGTTSANRSRDKLLEFCASLPTSPSADTERGLHRQRTAELIRQPPGAPLKCALFVYYHFAKAGGTSIREGIERQLETFKHLPRYKLRPLFANESWSDNGLLQLRPYDAVERFASDDDFRRSFPRLFVECHSSCLFVRMASQLARTRPRLEQLGCTVFAMTHLRDPVHMAVSAWYYWAAKWKAEGHTSLENFLQAIRPDKFWVDYLFGGHSEEMTRRWRKKHPDDPCSTFAEYVDRLLGTIDLVALTSHWEESWLQAAAALHLPRLEPRTEKTLKGCIRKVRDAPPRHLQGFCRKIAPCNTTRPADPAMLAEYRKARMRCSAEAYDRWAPRAIATLHAYQDGLAPAERALFFERACHLKANYFCTWLPPGASA